MNQPYIDQTSTLENVAAEEHAMSRLLELAIQPDSMENYLQQGIEMMIDLVPYLKLLPRGGIFLTVEDESRNHLQLVANYNLSSALRSRCAEVEFGHCLCGRAALEKEIVFASCVDERHDVGYDGMQSHGHYIVPILVENNVLGIIMLYLPDGYEKTKREVAFLKRVARVFGLGISNRYMLKDIRASKVKAEEGNIAKIEFLNKVSHELRTPLNGVIGLTQALECTDLDEEQEEIVSALLQNGKSLLELINDVLGYSDINSGRLKAGNSSFSLKDVFNNVENQIVKKIESKSQDQILSIHIDKTIPRILIGDSKLLEKVLINLANNAIKFSDEGSEIKISVSVDDKNEDALVALFAVKDSGIGMSTEEQSRLFQQFDQVDNSTRRRYGGLGIGLVICKELVKLMGGEIWVDSTPGQGSTFYFTVQLTVA